MHFTPERPSVNTRTAGIAHIALFAALIAVLALPPALPVGPVPITAQTLGVMLAGAVLGPWRGAAAVLLFQVMVAAGLPLLAGGRGGIGAFFGPSGGYLIGWLAGAFVVGLIVHVGATRPTWLRVIAGHIVGGVLVVFAFGIPVQAFVTGTTLGEAAVASLVFIPGGILKITVATLVTLALWKAYPRAFGQLAQRRQAKPATAQTTAEKTTAA